VRPPGGFNKRYGSSSSTPPGHVLDRWRRTRSGVGLHALSQQRDSHRETSQHRGSRCFCERASGALHRSCSWQDTYTVVLASAGADQAVQRSDCHADELT